MPTKRAGPRPGPRVTAIRSTGNFPFSIFHFPFFAACFRARLKTCLMFLTCSRAAREGTTPPYLAWSLTCEEITFDKTVISSPRACRGEISITDIAVSSQDVSIPKIFMIVRFYHFYCPFNKFRAILSMPNGLIFFNFCGKILWLHGPIVYRLGHLLFKQRRRVRLSLGLPGTILRLASPKTDTELYLSKVKSEVELGRRRV